MKRFLFLLVLSVLLILLSLLLDQRRRESQTKDQLLSRISKNLSRSLTDLSNEASLIQKDSALRWSSLKNNFYLLEGGDLIKWSRNNLAIQPSELFGAQDLSLLKMFRSRVIVRKWELADKKILVGVIPLSTDHRIVNQFIQPWINEEIFPSGTQLLDASASEGADVCLQQKCLFKVQEGSDSTNGISLIMAVLGLCLLSYFIFTVVHHLHIRKKYFIAFVFLFVSLAVMRIAMVQFSFPSRWSASTFFNPAYFASSSFNSSLLDFFFNSLIVAISCGYLFVVNARFLLHKKLNSLPAQLRWLVSAAFLSFAYFSFLFPYLFVEAIFHDSKIIFDLSVNVDFDGVRLMATAAVIFGCISSFFFMHIWVRWAMNLCESASLFFTASLAALFTFAAYAFFSEHNYWITISLGTVYILFVYFSRYYASLQAFSFKSAGYLLLPAILFSLQIALADRLFSEERKMKSMLRFASSTLDRDVLGEYLLNDVVQAIAADPFIHSSMSNPLLSKRSVRDKILEKYLTSYFDRYQAQIALFKTDGLPADPLTNSDLASSVKSYVNDANQTQYKNIYFVRGKTESLVRYLAVVNLSPEAGFIIIDLTLKRVIPKQTLPELVVDNRFSQSFNNTDFSFAFYNDQSLIGSFGSFNFPNTPLIDWHNHQSYQADGFLVVTIPDENSRTIVVAGPSYRVFMVLANFSFFFAAGVGLIFCALGFLLLIEYRRGVAVSYTARIQSFAYLSFILPLVVVSFIALRMITSSNENQVLENNIERGRSISEEISELMNKPAGNELSIKNYITEISRAFSLDLNVFDLSGNIIASSSPEVVETGLISGNVNRLAFEKLFYDHEKNCQLPGKIGRLEYTSLFFPIRSDLTGDFVGILELPFIRYDAFVAKSKVNVLANILVIFSGVFLLFAVLTIVSVNSFTWPFRLMARTLKSTRIGGNELMKWNSNDEIGLMVKEYNQMVANLERSKQALEKSHRESAWREIAQQVAHEIKNPLTPIKLTLQQIEKSLPDGMDAQKMERSVKTLLSQVDTLNDIATAFSSFAKMPSPNILVVDASALLKDVINLHRNHANRKVELTSEFNCQVNADPKLLAGVFSNIILNAFQSRQENESVDVEISCTQNEKYCTLFFKDNGPGIPDAWKDKIFVPHFSSKQSGSGLGLAISRQAIESMGGKIGFESAEKSGTTFFVEILKAT